MVPLSSSQGRGVGVALATSVGVGIGVRVAAGDGVIDAVALGTAVTMMVCGVGAIGSQAASNTTEINSR
jgi:hypothetical protein